MSDKLEDRPLSFGGESHYNNAEVSRLRLALTEALAQNERFNTRYRDAEAEIERLEDNLRSMTISRDWYADSLKLSQAEVERLSAALRDEYAGHEGYVDTLSCDAGNFDGGNSRDCEHCQHRRRLEVLDALFADIRPPRH